MRSLSRALATFQSNGKARKQEAILILNGKTRKQ